MTANNESRITNKDELELSLIDAGAEDIAWHEDGVTVTSDVSMWTAVRDILTSAGFAIRDAGMKYLPTQKTAVADPGPLMTFVEALEEDDDVAEVHTNAEIS